MKQPPTPARYSVAVLVHLVRHGQSTWNADRRLQGQTAHPPLTELGRTQARHALSDLTKRIGDQECAIFSSDLVRACETAAIIAAGLGVAVTESTALREQHLGALEGRLSHELFAEPVPDGQHISEVRWGGGESVADVYTRLRAFFDHTLPTAPPHLIVVTHGDALQIAAAALTGHSHREVEWRETLNGSVRTIEPLTGPRCELPGTTRSQ